MKKLSSSILLVATFAVAIGFNACKSKMKDADIKTAVETALKANPGTAGTVVEIKDGIATITGECKDQLCKETCEKLVGAVKGVKSVVNNTTIATPATSAETIVNAADDVLNKGLADALKDIPGVVSKVVDGKIALTGEISKLKWAMLKQTLDKLTPKGYDLSGLKIK